MGEIRQGDRKDLFLGFFTLASILAAHALGETARDALFLSGLTADRLPWAYLTIAGLALVVVRANSAMLERTSDKRWLLVKTMIGAAVINLGFWFWLRGDPPQGRAFVLYVWTGLFATVSVVQFWLLLDDVVDVAKAKRIFGPVAAGGVLGALLGSFVAERLVDAGFGPRNLMAAASLCLFMGASIPLRWRREVRPPAPVDSRIAFGSLGRDLRVLCEHVYLRRLLALVLVSTIALTGLDFVFKSVVGDHFAGVPNGAAELSRFFARFYLAMNIVSLIGQLFLSGWLLRTFGVNQALFVLPTLLLLGAGAFIVAPVLLPALIVKGTDGSLRHSLHRTGMEVLYLPVSRELRERFKGLIDGVGQRGGQALASILILGGLSIGLDTRGVMIGVLLMVAAWLLVSVLMRKPYLALFRESLQTGGPTWSSSKTPLDLKALETMLAALNSEQDEEVLVTLDLFAEYDRVAIIPRLILYHPSSEVTLRALELFTSAEDTSILPIARRLVQQGQTPDVRAAAMRACSLLESDEGLLESHLDDETPEVATTALVGLVAANMGKVDELRARLSELVLSGEPATQIALATAVGDRRDRSILWVLDDLLASSNVEVQEAAVRALAKMPDTKYVATLLPLLHRWQTRAPARATLRAMGDEALDVLAVHLADTRLPRRIRRHLPRTIHRFDNAKALEVLQRQLPAEWDGAVRYKILRGMGRLMQNNPALPLDRELIRATIRTHLRRVYRFEQWRVAIHKTMDTDPEVAESTGAELLAVCLREKRTNALERIFRCLQMLDPQETFKLYWQGLGNNVASLRAASRELLEHALPSEFRAPLLALLDDVPAETRVTRAGLVLQMSSDTPAYSELIRRLASDGSDTLSAIAEYHLAEMGYDHEPRPAVADDGRSTSAVAEVVGQTLSGLQLSGGRSGG
ncbi:MAG: hypothetical protein AAF411_14515 [Myxococcota bacterium]